MGKTELTKLTKKEWMDKGIELFGDDMLKWKFVCPSCGNIQSPGDFKKHKDSGATPNDAYFNCIGRFVDGEVGEMCEGEKPCNYTTGGLFNISPILVIDGDKELSAFAFAEKEAA